MSLSHRVTLNDLTNEADTVFASPSLLQWKNFSTTPNCKTPLKRVRSESAGRSRIARNIRHYENLSSLSNTPVRAGRLDDMMDRTGASSLFSPTERASLANENVFVRVRPSSSTKKCIQISDDERHISVKQHQGSANKQLDFSCESIFSEESSQQDVYEKMGQEMLNKFLDGTNICIFAYGQTGSGKTHSILGNSSEPGLLPRFCTELFSSNHINKENIENIRNTSESLFSVKVSFYELYLEKVYDLLAQTRAPLRIRGADSAYLENLSQFEVFSQAELEEVLHSGLTRRATATTLVNDLSSRSHAIFQIVLERTNREVVDNVEKESVIQSKCYFVDLAGSERLHMTTGYENRAETSAINCSLLALQKVIESKSSCSTSAFVNYRESVLTRLLKQCFGGNSLTSLLATVSPEQQYSQLSIGTLRFASKAALVDQTARQNVDPFVMAVQGLKAQNDEMKAEIERLRSDHANHSVRITIGSVSYKGMQGPCVLELLADATLNQCTQISNDKEATLEFSSAAEDKPSVSFVSVETEQIRLDVLGEHVAVNGQLMQQGVQLVLNHGDRIVLAGTRFFVFLSAFNASSEEVPSYERVKLEFVEGTFPIVERKLIEQARLEFEVDKREMMRKVNQELNVARRELEDLKQANLKKTTRNVSMVTETVEAQEEEDLNKMCSEMEESIRETEEVKEKLEKIVDSSNQTNLFSTFDNLSCEEKEELMRLKACISTANNILERFDKRSLFLFKLVSNSASDIERVSVRLINLKSRVFADLLANDFIVQIYEKLVEIYQESASSSDGMAQVEAILYSGTWQWRKGMAGRRSNIFTTALFNSMKDTARMRQSNRCDSQTSLRSRRSVISEVLDMAKDNREKMTPLQEQLQLLKENVDEDYSDFELGRNLLRACLELEYKMELAVASTSQFFQDKTSVDIEQHKDTENTSFSSATSSEIDAKTPIFLMLERSTATDHIITEMNSVVTLVFNDKTRWVMALAEKSESSKFFIRNINNHLKLMQTLIGRLAYLVNEPFPEDEVFRKAEHSFQIGVLQSIDEVCEDVLDVYKAFQNNSTPRAHIITILCKCIKDVHQELTTSTYNATLAFDVLRPLVYYKNKLAQNQADWAMLLEKFQFMVEQIDEIYELQEGEHLAMHLKASLQACINIIEAVVNKPEKKTN
uniref:Kinesin motor domain-containing protein n=1 Tax=Ditylenchus dipsaci TaxID=166011 RepID=A0A915ECR4_9BILA